MVRIVYGGSVTETNADKLIELPDVDGFMIGSTSTKPIFRTIFDIVNTQAETQWILLREEPFLHEQLGVDKTTRDM